MIHNQPKFKPAERSDFYRVLRERVNQYFVDTNQQTTANLAMKLRALILIVLWVGLYVTLVFAQTTLIQFYLLWIGLGIVIPLVSVNIGHDAIHGSFTKSKIGTWLLSHTFNLNGASAYMWKISHNVAHHTFTNIHGHDEDINPAPFIRISPGTPLLKVHRYQHLYSFFFYGLATLSWVLMKDYKQFFQNRIANYKSEPHPKIEVFFLFFYKALYYALFIFVPLFLTGYGWGHVVIGFLIMHFISGYYLSIIFMLAHGVEQVHFNVPEADAVVEKDWAIHQMCTTANFSTNNKLAAFLTGGLNQQVEHHLFPNVCSVHYPAISGIVRTTAKEFNVPYLELPTFFGSLQSHIRFLKKLGREEVYIPAI